MNSYCFCPACILLPSFDKHTFLFQWKSTISSVLLDVGKVIQLISHCHPKDMTQARFIRVFYPPALGNWVKDGCLANLSTMTDNSRTSVELEGRSNPPPLTPALPAKTEGVSLELPRTTTREEIDYLSGNETNRESRVESNRETDKYIT